MKAFSESFKKYNKLVHPSRVHLLKSAGINCFISNLNPRELHAFLMVWTAFSVKMTENVEQWILRAGQSCEKKQLSEVGAKLKYHAAQEANHDLMLIDDLKVLVAKWNTIYKDSLTEQDIYSFTLPTNANAYIDLHEATINGQHPYAQVAIEYEIERISVNFGPKMIENVINTLGQDFEEGISFLADHVLIDQGHTKFNIDLLEKCFNADASLDALVITGASALKIYAGYLNECIIQSTTISSRGSWSTASATL